MINQYINHMSKNVCPPGMCKEHGFSNEEEVTHWIFDGDGVHDYEQRDHEAEPKAVKDYIKYCQEQIMLAQEYLVSLDSESAGNFILCIAGMFDTSIKSEDEFIMAILRLKAHKWMMERVDDAIHDKADELLRFDQVNATLLAEECVYDSKIWPEHLHTEILDDETYWIWDLAVDVAEAYDQDKLIPSGKELIPSGKELNQ